jgi:hypothetical protein
MRVETTEAVRKRARWAHDLFVLNILFFHLLLTPATIVLGIGELGLLLPLGLSGLVIAFIYYRSRRAADWFVAAHWRLSFSRCKLLIWGYLGSGVIFLVGWLIASGAQGDMQHIMLVVFTRIAIMPTLILVMITVVLEASATGLVSRGEVPDQIARRFPPHHATVIEPLAPGSVGD